ncbi:hypothetical protein [Rhodanobacter aciditrophus]|uniref:hypothetical protein n=1 Tax=Rhodanobacter aciditrophus TaxID=1623218 RepID=UPI003CE6C022
MTTTMHPASMTTEQRDQARRTQFTGTINVDYYEVTACHGRTQVTLRPIAAHRQATGSMVGDCTPVPGKFTGEPMRCKVDGSSNTVRLSSFQRASKIEPLAVVDGLRVWPVDHWTAYG